MFRKRSLMTVIAAVLVLGIAGAVWAAAANAPAANAQAAIKLTEAQRKEMLALYQQMLETRKQIIKKQVEFKVLTPAEGKAAEARLDVMTERLENWDGTVGPGMMGMGMGGFRGGRGGMRPGGPRGGWRGQAGACPNCGAPVK